MGCSAPVLLLYGLKSATTETLQQAARLPSEAFFSFAYLPRGIFRAFNVRTHDKYTMAVNSPIGQLPPDMLVKAVI
jgi:hypothetical protein